MRTFRVGSPRTRTLLHGCRASACWGLPPPAAARGLRNWTVTGSGGLATNGRRCSRCGWPWRRPAGAPSSNGRRPRRRVPSVQHPGGRPHLCTCRAVAVTPGVAVLDGWRTYGADSRADGRDIDGASPFVVAAPTARAPSPSASLSPSTPDEAEARRWGGRPTVGDGAPPRQRRRGQGGGRHVRCAAPAPHRRAGSRAGGRVSDAPRRATGCTPLVTWAPRATMRRLWRVS